MKELLNKIIELQMDINKIYTETKAPVYKNLSEKSCLELAEIYYTLRSMLP